MHDNTALGYLQRSLQYLFRPGNLLYCGALAAVFIALRLLGDEGLAGVGMFIWFAAFALIAVFACKMLDSIQRLILGLEAEPVPLDVLSKLPKSVAIEAVIAVIFYGVIIYFIQLPLEGESRAFAFKTASVLLYALTPAIVLGLLLLGDVAVDVEAVGGGAGLATASELGLNGARHRGVDIGIGRYLIALLVPFLFALLILVIYILFARLILPAKALNLYNSTSGAYGAPVIVYIVIILRGLIFAALLALPLLYFSWFYPPPAETIDPAKLDIDDSELAHINMDDALLAELNRLKAEEERVAQRHRRAPPIDLNLLREADTEHMSAEEQRTFAQELMQADVFIRQGENEQAIALLEKYTDGLHDTNHYLPAYKRLQQLYRRQNRLDDMQAMEIRLIEATASGNPHSYAAIHHVLDETPDGVLPADWILPLAQTAAGKQHYDTVLKLTRGFAKHHPGHPHIVENYFLSARALAKKGERDKAQQLLQQLLARYPDHAKAIQIRRTLELMQQRGA